MYNYTLPSPQVRLDHLIGGEFDKGLYPHHEEEVYLGDEVENDHNLPPLEEPRMMFQSQPGVYKSFDLPAEDEDEVPGPKKVPREEKIEITPLPEPPTWHESQVQEMDNLLMKARVLLTFYENDIKAMHDEDRKLLKVLGIAPLQYRGN